MSSSPSSSSISSSSVHQVTLPTLSYNSYPIRRTSHKGTRLILSSTSQPLHLVHPSTFTPNTPDITIHTGPTTTTPILGVCNFPSLSRNIVVGLGDPSTTHPNAIEWETLSKSSRDHSIYSFNLPMLEPPTNASTAPLDSDSNPTQRQTYTWRRTRHPHKYLNQSLNPTTTTTHTSIHLSHSNLARRSWKLTSSTPTTTTHSPQTPTKNQTQQTQIHALFISTPAILSPHNTGTLYVFSSSSSSSYPSSNTSPQQPLQIQPPPSTPWILLTYSAISEKARRRALARRDLSWFF